MQRFIDRVKDAREGSAPGIGCTVNSRQCPILQPNLEQKGGNPKGGGKGKEGGSKDQPKANPGSKSKAPGGTPKTEAKAKG